MGHDELTMLLQMLTTGGDESREVAAMALGRLGRAAIESLSALQNLDNTDARWWVARALAEVGGEGAVRPLMGCPGRSGPRRACLCGPGSGSDRGCNRGPCCRQTAGRRQRLCRRHCRRCTGHDRRASHSRPGRVSRIMSRPTHGCWPSEHSVASTRKKPSHPSLALWRIAAIWCAIMPRRHWMHWA